MRVLEALLAQRGQTSPTLCSAAAASRGSISTPRRSQERGQGAGGVRGHGPEGQRASGRATGDRRLRFPRLHAAAHLEWGAARAEGAWSRWTRNGLLQSVCSEWSAERGCQGWFRKNGCVASFPARGAALCRRSTQHVWGGMLQFASSCLKFSRHPLDIRKRQCLRGLACGQHLSLPLSDPQLGTATHAHEPAEWEYCSAASPTHCSSAAAGGAPPRSRRSSSGR